MAKKPDEMTLAELAREMCKREDSLDHLTAKAELARRDAEAKATNNRYMLASVIVAAIAALASALSAHLAYLNAAVGH